MVVASNRASTGVYEDTTGPLIVEALQEWGFEVGDPVVVGDGAPVTEAIRAALADGADVVLTTGGTGINPTDGTPEATRRCSIASCPGIAEAIRAYGVANGVPTAMLSRGLAGVSGTAVIVNLPGSRGGVKDGLAVLADVSRTPSTSCRRRSSRWCSREPGLAGRPEARSCRRTTDPTTRCVVRGPGSAAENAEWLGPWEATLPREAGQPATSYVGMISTLRRRARHGQAMPFVVTWNGEMVGLLTVNGITWGSARWASMGYWVAKSHAGRGVTPTAVALVTDHLLTTTGLHRVEISIRPENAASLRVVEKLGFTEIGTAPGSFTSRALAGPPGLPDRRRGR